MIGLNYRLSEVLSAIGRVQLRHVDDWNNQRRANAAVYEELLAGRNLPVTLTAGAPVGRSHPHALRRAGAEARRAGRPPAKARHRRQPRVQAAHPPERPYVERFGFRPGQCPVSEQVAHETLILPNWPGLTRGDVEYVVDAIEEFFRDR